MASKELKDALSNIIWDACAQDEKPISDSVDEIISTILAALQEPTEAMLKEAHKAENESAVHSYGSLPSATDYWDFMLNASALGEQSE